MSYSEGEDVTRLQDLYTTIHGSYGARARVCSAGDQGHFVAAPDHRTRQRKGTLKAAAMAHDVVGQVQEPQDQLQLCAGPPVGPARRLLGRSQAGWCLADRIFILLLLLVTKVAA